MLSKNFYWANEVIHTNFKLLVKAYDKYKLPIQIPFFNKFLQSWFNSHNYQSVPQVKSSTRDSGVPEFLCLVSELTNVTLNNCRRVISRILVSGWLVENMFIRSNFKQWSALESTTLTSFLITCSLITYYL